MKKMMEKMIKKKDKKAFTLIELIVVIAVVGILVLLGMPRFIGHTERAELTRIQHDVKVMEQEIGTVLISNDDDFNKWEDNSKDFNQLIQENKLFDREGVVEEIEDLSIDKTYKVIPEKYKDNINTKLKGTFYANNGGKVYYEHVKPLFGNPNGSTNPNGPESPNGPENPVESENPAEPGEEPGHSDENVNNKEGLMNPIEPREPIEGETVIDSADEFAKIGTEEYPLDGDYILTSDIDLSGINWKPIGVFSRYPFTGTLNGNGYKIINLTSNWPVQTGVGLFGHTEGAIISNVALEDIDVTGNSKVGGLVGSAHNNTTIENSYATGEVKSSGTERWGSVGAGGLVGEVRNGTEITNSYATGSVTSHENVGGLVGSADGADGGNTISNSYATGEVSGYRRVGGLVGSTLNSTIENSYATGKVKGSRQIAGSNSASENVGGLVGWASNGTISSSYATGEVYGENRVGGFVGFINAGTIRISKSYATGPVRGNMSVGGFVGRANGGIINNSYAEGPVTGTDWDIGGFVGWVEHRTSISNTYATGLVAGTREASRKLGGLVGNVDGSQFPISNSYWNTDTTGQENSTGYYQYSNEGSGHDDYLAGGKGKTAAEMKQSETYEGWNFEEIWKIEEGKDYPKLR